MVRFVKDGSRKRAGYSSSIRREHPSAALSYEKPPIRPYKVPAREGFKVCAWLAYAGVCVAISAKIPAARIRLQHHLVSAMNVIVAPGSSTRLAGDALVGVRDRPARRP